MKYQLLRLIVALLVLFGATLCIRSNPEESGIDEVWRGASTNGLELLCVKLTTNGYGALYGGGGNMGFPGTFTYTLFHGEIRYVTNGTPFLTGTLRYDRAADILIYQRSAEPARLSRETGESMILRRNTNAMENAFLGSIIGLTNYIDVLKKMGQWVDSLTNNAKALPANSEEQQRTQPSGAANRSQPAQPQTNRAPAAAGSGR